MSAEIAVPTLSSEDLLDGQSKKQLSKLVDDAHSKQSSKALAQAAETTLAQLQASNNKKLVKQAGAAKVDDLLQQMLAPGEERVSKPDAVLRYESVEFFALDHNDEQTSEAEREFSAGELILSNRRLLLVSSEAGVEGSVERDGWPAFPVFTVWDRIKACFGSVDPKLLKMKFNTLSASVTSGEQTNFYPLPLAAVRHLEFHATNGVRSTADVDRHLECCLDPYCADTCGDDCCIQWACCCQSKCITEPVEIGKAEAKKYSVREVNLAILLPPWGRHYNMRISFGEEVPNQAITQMLGQLQQHAPNLNVVHDAGTAKGPRVKNDFDRGSDDSDDSDGSDDSDDSDDSDEKSDA